MIRNRIMYGFAVAAAVGFSIAYTGKVSAVILFIMIGYPFAAAICTIIQAVFFRADFEQKRIVSDKDTLFEMFISVKNGSIFPCIPAEIRCMLPDSDSGVFVEKRIFAALPPFGKTRLSVNCRHIYRGSYSCRIKSIAVVDPLRIIRVTMRKKNECVSVFLPRRLVMLDFIKTAHGDQSYTQNSIFAERDDFSHVREYRDGDIYQMVHWKLTAKSDDIMIKQYDSLSEQRAEVLLGWNGSDGDILLRTDTVIETAVALVSELLKKDIKSYIDYGGDTLCKVSDVGEFERFYDLMSVIPVNPDSTDFCAKIGEIDLNGLSVLVLITPELSEEIVARANIAAGFCTVYLAFVNLAMRPVPLKIYNERFRFLDIRGSGGNALNVAVQVMKDNSEGA